MSILCWYSVQSRNLEHFTCTRLHVSSPWAPTIVTAPSTQPLRFDPRQSRKWPGPERLASSVAELLSAAVNGQEAVSVQPEGMGYRSCWHTATLILQLRQMFQNLELRLRMCGFLKTSSFESHILLQLRTTPLESL